MQNGGSGSVTTKQGHVVFGQLGFFDQSRLPDIWPRVIVIVRLHTMQNGGSGSVTMKQGHMVFGQLGFFDQSPK